ncbi:MAG: serine/threonine-protein kinase [Candidatus Eremiobacterota bacterium]
MATAYRSLLTEMNSSLLGLTLKNRYNIIKLLGKGGQCYVYLAFDTERQEEVVVKELIHKSKDQEILEQNIILFKKEYELLHRMDHKGLPKGYDYFQEKDRHFLVVEYVSGENLKTILENKEIEFSEQQVIELAIQMAEVLVYLSHMKPHQVLIRDIKPANIMLTPEGVINFIDFTIARESDPSKTGDTVRIGSIGYAPPEQYKGKSDVRSDIYALGATMYQMLTKHDPSIAPFQFEPVRHLNPAISKNMEGILKKALELDPSMRYQKPEDILHDLSSIRDGKDIAFDYKTLVSTFNEEPEPVSPPPRPLLFNVISGKGLLSLLLILSVLTAIIVIIFRMK